MRGQCLQAGGRELKWEGRKPCWKLLEREAAGSGRGKQGSVGCDPAELCHRAELQIGTEQAGAAVHIAARPGSRGS